MLNPFPQLLDYAIFAPMLLRLAAAGMFLFMAYVVYKHRKQASHASLPIIGEWSWGPAFTTVVYSLIGLSLFFGYYTQIGALFGALAALKEMFWGRRMQALFPLSRSTAVLLFVICLSLLITGAGAFAFDIPL